jgi:hypothetical protein
MGLDKPARAARPAARRGAAGASGVASTVPPRVDLVLRLIVTSVPLELSLAAGACLPYSPRYGPLPDPRPQVADRIDFPTSGTPRTGLIPADRGRPLNVRQFLLLAGLSDRSATRSSPACLPGTVVAAAWSHAGQDNMVDRADVIDERRAGCRQQWSRREGR